MKKKVGNPDKINQNLISLIEKLKINYFYLKNRKILEIKSGGN